MDAQPRIDDGHRIRAHLAGADRVIGRLGGLAHPVEDLVVAVAPGARRDLRHLQRRHRWRGHDGAGDAHGAHGQFAVDRRRQEVEADLRRLARIGGNDVDVALALGSHRMGVAGDARLARDPRPARARFGEHRHPAQQQVGRGEPLARAHEGTQRRADHR